MRRHGFRGSAYIWVGRAVLLLVVLAGKAESQTADEFFYVPNENNYLLEVEAAQQQWREQQANFPTAQLGIEIAAIVRLSGPDVVPFTLKRQQPVIEAFQEVVVPAMGAVDLHTYREGYPDPLAPLDAADLPGAPYVDVSGTIWHLLNNPRSVALAARTGNATWQAGWEEEFGVFLEFAGSVATRGLDASVRFLSMNLALGVLREPVPLRYVVPMQVLLAVQLEPTTAALAPLSPTRGRRLLANDRSKSIPWAALDASQSTDLEVALDAALQGWQSSDVQVLNISSTDLLVQNGTVLWGDGTVAFNISQLELDPAQTALVYAEITVYACNATIEAGIADGTDPPMTCEEDATRAAVNAFFSQTPSADLGFMVGGRVVSVRKRPSPGKPVPVVAPPPSGAEPARPLNNGWVPWHLDMLDQRDLPLDKKYTATADGTGVNIYLISSGVMGGHQEFQYGNGAKGSRVRPGWGYNGLDPLQDCGDGFAWYYFGTYAASIIAGRSVGVARNATIHSVRMRENCLLESPDIWGPGGLPSAMDAVLSTFQRPGVLVIDAWWSRDRLVSDNDDFIEETIRQRLSRAAELDIPIVTGAGLGLDSTIVCENIFTQGESVIRVSAVNEQRHLTTYAPTNVTCIDIWGPGGDAGQAMIGADGLAPDAYRSVVPRAFGASWLVAGIAAQYLQFHPNATTAELKAALLHSATNNVIIGTGIAPNVLAYTNMTLDPVQNQKRSSSGNDGLATTAVILAITLPICISLLILIGIICMLALRRSQRRRRNAMLGAALDKRKDEGSIEGIVLHGGNCGDQNGHHVDSNSNGSGGSGPPRNHASHGSTLSVSTGVPNSFSLPSRHDWEILPSQIRKLRRADGSPWVLGRGQWGEVHRALKDGIQAVAVKTLKAGNEESSSHLQDAFAREIAMMQWLSRDANVVQFFGAVVKQRELMLVTELMEGGDLRAALTADREGKLRWHLGGKAIALGVARGLHFLHSHGVVHRDVKSKNILITRDGRAKLADVGLAHVLEIRTGGAADDAPVPGQGSGGFVGTLSWAAPEMLLGDDFTAKADIYSFGVVLWEIATQQVPVRGRIQLPRVPEECPQGVADAIAACMSLNPDDRPSARQVYAMLLRCPPRDGYDEELEELPSTPLSSLNNLGENAETTPRGISSPRVRRLYSTPSFSNPVSTAPSSPFPNSPAEPTLLASTAHNEQSGGFAGSGISSSFGRTVGALTPGMRRVVLQIRQRMQTNAGAEDVRQARVSPASPSVKQRPLTPHIPDPWLMEALKAKSMAHSTPNIAAEV